MAKTEKKLENKKAALIKFLAKNVIDYACREMSFCITRTTSGAEIRSIKLKIKSIHNIK